MIRRLTIALLLLLIAVAGLYQLRTQLLVSTINNVLAGANARLVQLDGLEMGWVGASVDKLVIELGAPAARQTLLRVEFGYSIVDLELKSLSIGKAIVALPESDANSAADLLPVLLSHTFESIITAPVSSVAVSHLELPGVSHELLSQPLSLRASKTDSTIALQVGDSDANLLDVELGRAANHMLGLNASLSQGDKVLVDISATLNKQQGELSLEGAGRLQFTPTRALLASHLNIPRLLTQAHGELVFELSGLFDDNLALLNKGRWQLTILPDTKLAFELSNENLDATFHMGLPDSLTVSLEPGAGEVYAVRVEGQGVSWKMEAQRPSMTAQGKLSAVLCVLESALRCEAGMFAAIQAERLTLPGEETTVIQDSEIELRAQIELIDNSITLVFEAGEWWSASTITQGDMRVNGPALIADGTARVNIQLPLQSLDFKAGQVRLLLPGVQLPELSIATVLTMENLKFGQGKNGDVSMAAHLSAGAVNIKMPDTWVPALGLDADIELVGEVLSVNGES